MIRKNWLWLGNNKAHTCVGETCRNVKSTGHASGEEQLKEALNGLKFSAEQLVIAYEPVWAIGTGINASCNDARQMCRLVRESGGDAHMKPRIQEYCMASVNADNIAMFLVQPDIDGALVGARLEAASFAAIVE